MNSISPAAKPAKVFFILFTILNVYTLICFLIVLQTETKFWLFLPGYGIGIYALLSPILLFVYGSVYLFYKKYDMFPYQNAAFIFNFLYLFFLVGTLIYDLVNGN
ncbi:MAG: hypothetical protein JSS63_10770 [Bacteroidetes bacterium]|nr:hypothetical protein [Bacteroidota bacterium]